MPARPLQSVKRSAKVVIDHNALREHPTLATLIAYAITDWARVEANLGKAFILMLGAEARPAAAMYGSLKSPQAKAETFLAVAKMTLSVELVETFEAVLIHVNRVAEIRNRLAHGLWATSHAIPNALLLVDARHELARQRDMTKIVWSDLDEMPDEAEIPKIHPKDVFVYFEKDLQEEIERISTCFQYTNSLCSLAGTYVVGQKYSEAETIKIGLAQAHARTHNWLRSEPPIQKVLNRTKKAPADAL